LSESYYPTTGDYTGVIPELRSLYPWVTPRQAGLGEPGPRTTDNNIRRVPPQLAVILHSSDSKLNPLTW
ncbi:hypothetical protein A2U01_0004790, partial [Trifolium medium]|nr:hypothetical protein [Trifolium medium]